MTDKLLLIFDLNGTLVDSTHHKRDKMYYDFRSRTKFVYLRPYLDDFLQFLKKLKSENKIEIAIWTSCIKENSRKILEKLFFDNDIKLLFHWSRENCIELEDYKTIKDLNRVWHNFGNQYHKGNTFIIDDSKEKIKDEHYENLILIEEYRASESSLKEDKVLLNLKEYINKLTS